MTTMMMMMMMNKDYKVEKGARKMYLSVSGRATFVVFAYGAKMASAGPVKGSKN